MISSRSGSTPGAAPRRAVGQAATGPLLGAGVPAWEPIDLSTAIGRLVGVPFLVGDFDGGTLLIEAQGVGDPTSVRAWSSRGNRRLNARAYSTVSSLAATLGLVAHSAIAVPPPLRWRIGRAPVFGLDGERPVSLAGAVARFPRPRSAADRVAQVRAEYGRLLGDLVYRIENAALFDSAEPVTARFETALALWAESGIPAGKEAERLAGMVQVTFAAARSNAESLGLSHLPAQSRAEARRAAGAARLAASTTSAAERLAAERQVTRILGSLSLYYLPASYRAAVTAGDPP